MSGDPRNLNYPSHDDSDRTTDDAPERVEGEAPDGGNRRTGTSDDLKELDRVERRKERA